MNDDLVVTRTVRIPRHELQVSFSASGGPGGQHANKAATRVELRFDVAGSSAFGPVQRQRVLDRLGAEVRVVVDDERSQLRNRVLAEERLVARLQSALHVDRPRRPTKPSRGSQERRIRAKQQRGEIKRQRRRPGRDD
ncbi:MAG TPA: alternative ribosome rescue aminoacyl-tRNA hydrolase ArfB [Ilumatobacter sp.]